MNGTTHTINNNAIGDNAIGDNAIGDNAIGDNAIGDNAIGDNAISNDHLLNTFITEELINDALRAVIDPELGINIIDLGLVYRAAVGDDGRIDITMTLTTPGCPMHASFAEDIEQTLWTVIPGMSGVDVNLVWEPRWNPSMISPEGLADLGLA